MAGGAGPRSRPAVIGADELRARIARIPRVRLACLPTPLSSCPNLSADLGVDLRVKRDDLTGLALGGNKTRNLGAVVFIHTGGQPALFSQSRALADCLHREPGPPVSGSRP